MKKVIKNTFLILVVNTNVLYFYYKDNTFILFQQVFNQFFYKIIIIFYKKVENIFLLIYPQPKITKKQTTMKF